MKSLEDLLASGDIKALYERAVEADKAAVQSMRQAMELSEDVELQRMLGAVEASGLLNRGIFDDQWSKVAGQEILDGRAPKTWLDVAPCDLSPVKPPGWRPTGKEPPQKVWVVACGRAADAMAYQERNFGPEGRDRYSGAPDVVVYVMTGMEKGDSFEKPLREELTSLNPGLEVCVKLAYPKTERGMAAAAEAREVVAASRCASPVTVERDTPQRENTWLGEHLLYRETLRRRGLGAGVER